MFALMICGDFNIIYLNFDCFIQGLKAFIKGYGELKGTK